jgi:hypothetical protein
MEAVCKILKSPPGTTTTSSDHAETKYEPLYDSPTHPQLDNETEKEHAKSCFCKHCGSLAHMPDSASPSPSARKRVTVRLLIGIVLLVLWTILVGFLARNPHVLQRDKGPRNLVEQCEFSDGYPMTSGPAVGRCEEKIHYRKERE